MDYYIYGFRVPDGEEIFYVGASPLPKSRLSHALSTARCGPVENKDKAIWLLRILLDGKRPELVLLGKGNDDTWQAKERQWIADLRKQGHRLTNKLAGGQPGRGRGLERQYSSYYYLRLTERLMGLLDTAVEQHGGTHEDLIREAIEAHWGKKNDARADAPTSGVPGNDSRGDG